MGTTDDTTRQAGYWLRSSTKAEQAYYITLQKCFAVEWSLLMLRLYLEGSSFSIRIDTNSIGKILNLADESGRLVRRQLRVSEFDFDGVYHEGIKYHGTDALSRPKMIEADTKPTKHAIKFIVVDSVVSGLTWVDLKIAIKF